MGQVRAPILHLSDTRVRIVRVLPLLIRSLARPHPIQPPQSFPGRRGDPRPPRQPLQKLQLVLSCGAQSERSAPLASSIVASMSIICPFSNPPLRHHPQHPSEHFPMRLQVDQPLDAGDRGITRRRFLQLQPQKTPQSQRVIGPPRDPPLRVDALKITDQ